MHHVLVSACLTGKDCKWDGGNNRNEELLELMERYRDTVEFHLICPEQMGGLSTPRPASEIRMTDRAVINTEGRDVTAEFVKGAELALEIGQQYGCRLAILKERSPSCGCHGVYDGTFSKKMTEGMGKAAELLSANGIRIFGESDLRELELELKK